MLPTVCCFATDVAHFFALASSTFQLSSDATQLWQTADAPILTFIFSKIHVALFGLLIGGLQVSFAVRDQKHIHFVKNNLIFTSVRPNVKLLTKNDVKINQWCLNKKKIHKMCVIVALHLH